MKNSIYPTLQHPNKLLERPGKDVVKIDDKIVKKLFATLAAQTNCAALAATQLGLELRITVINHSIAMDKLISCTDLNNNPIDYISVDHERPVCLINPKIIQRSEAMLNEIEGCMSVGGKIRERVKRNKQVVCQCLNEHGQEILITAEDFFSRCIQHELDHLDGKLFIDHLSPLKRKIVDRKFNKRTRKKV